MKNSKVLKTLLFLSGLIAMGVGGAILLIPVAFHATNGIELGSSLSLLNEVRAPGGALLAMGALILTGAFVSRLGFTSTIVSAFLYLSYGFSRILSMGIDGMPAEGLVLATVLEVTIGLVCAFALLRWRALPSRSLPPSTPVGAVLTA